MVPNKFPQFPSSLRIAVIGESPGKDEEAFGQPFVGASGRFLAALLSRAGISKESCYLGNISQYRPPDNDFSKFNWSGDEVQEGLYQLKKDMEQFKPNVVVLLGNVPLKAAKDAQSVHPLKPNSFKFKNSNWRGSLFIANSGGPFDGLKCIATYHPAYALRDYEVTPLLQFDLRKAVREGNSPILATPIRELITGLSQELIATRLKDIRNKKKTVALDIEGGIDTMSCISFATSPTEAFIVPINQETTLQVWRELALTLEDPYVPKILQNGLYDRFVLAYSYGIRVRGNRDDTMCKHWELYSELEKSLGVQCSIYTDEPYYKFERKSEDLDGFYKYCCRDSAVTLEISNKLDGMLVGSSLSHYKLNIALLNPILYMELRGIRYDSSSAAERRRGLLQQLHTCQGQLNALTGHGFSFESINEIKQKRDSLMLVKKGDRCYKEYEGSFMRVNELLNEPKPTLATIGELEDLCEVSLNVNSSKQFIPFLYEKLKLPTQYKEERGNPNPSPTADYEALLKLSRWCGQNNKTEAFQIVQKAIELRAIETRQRMLGISADRDGRIRCGYNLVGSNTGRITCYESPTGSGYNLQTIPNYTSTGEAPGGVLGDRDLFLADEGNYIFQCDLSGADGWTVAAYSAMLGDTTMLDDYKAGISPFKILTLMLRGVRVSSNRAELAQNIKQIGKDDWDRFACKRVQHGGCLTSDHEVLTKNGWLSIDKLTDEEIMVWDQITNSCFFEKPKGWTRFNYSGPLYSFEGNNISLLCTKEHRIPIDDNGRKTFTAEKCYQKKSGRVPYSTFYVGGGIEINGRLIAAYHADGCLNQKTETMNFHFRKERKIKRLLEIVPADVETRVYSNRDGTKTIDVRLNPNILGVTKKPGAYMLNWTRQNLVDYVDEIKHWDASIKGACVKFFSADKNVVDWTQTFIHLVGLGSVYQRETTSGFGSTIYSCSQNDRAFCWLASCTRAFAHTENTPVFCPSVSTTYFLYRRNNKIGITGNSYLEGGLTISRNILKDSEGKLYMTPTECDKLKDFFFQRYWGVRKWHDWVARRLKERPVLTAASGQVRQFFGRPDEILTKAVAFEPQANTTYATNLAAWRLWSDNENRITTVLGAMEENTNQSNLGSSGPNSTRNSLCRLRIEPLHQVHDALIGQFPQRDTAWSIGKIKQWFNNPLMIAGQQITIPFEGGYGRSWGQLDVGKI